MTKIRIGLLAIGLLVVVAFLTAGLLASNQGFFVPYQLLGSSDPGSFDGTNAIALPFVREPGIDTAKQLMDGIGFADVIDVRRYVESSGVTEVYTGRSGTPDPDFPLVPGEGYYVTLANNVNYNIRGSHDPTLTIDLDGPEEADSFDGTNFFANPFHSTASTAKELMDDIGSTSVYNISRYVRSSGTVQVYTGRLGSPDPDFNLTKGEAYFISMQNTVAYVPSHY